MRVGLFAPERKDCGVADHTRNLLRHLAGRVAVQHVAAERLEREDPEALGAELGAADVVHLEYEHGFFLRHDAPSRELDRLMRSIHRPALIALHCLPLEDPPWERWLRDPRVAYQVHSRTHLDALRKRGATSEIDVVYPPAPERAAPTVGPAAARRELAPRGEQLLVIFGFTKAHKGYLLALEALRALPANVKLVIAGGPQDERDEAALGDVLARARQLALDDRVEVTGYLDGSKVGAVLEAADVVLAPFESMTGSGSLATALAWQRPVVASDLPQLVELEREYGCLRLFPAGKAEELAAAVAAVLADDSERARLSAGAGRFAGGNSFARLADLTLRRYERLCAAGTQPSRAGGAG